MVAAVSAKSNEEIKSFLVRQKDTFRIPYQRYEEDRLRQCVFAGTTNTKEFFPFDWSGARRFLPIMIHAEKAEKHILDDEAEARAYFDQLWAEAMYLYCTAENPASLMKFSKEMESQISLYREQRMRVLGIDPGYAIVGWGVVDYVGNRFAPVDFGAVCTDAGVPFERRLDEVYTGVKEVIARTQPEVLAIEKLFYQHNQTTVIGVAEARGVILLAAAQAGLPIYEYTPMQVKQAVTGYGKAVKKQVQEMTRMLLSLPAVPKPDDTADALAMAITFCHTNGNQLNRYTRRVAGPI